MVTFCLLLQSFEGKQQKLAEQHASALMTCGFIPQPSKVSKEFSKADAVGCLTLFHQEHVLARSSRHKPQSRRHWPSFSDRNRVDGHAFTTSKVVDTSRYFRQRWVLNIQGTLLNKEVPLHLFQRASITVLRCFEQSDLP